MSGCGSPRNRPALRSRVEQVVSGVFFAGNRRLRLLLYEWWWVMLEVGKGKVESKVQSSGSSESSGSKWE